MEQSGNRARRNLSGLDWAGIFGFALCVISFGLLWGAIEESERGRRLAENPRASALIEKTWVEPGGKTGPWQVATLTFQREQKGTLVSCRLERQVIGHPWQGFYAGQTIDIVPQSDNCDDPDILLFDPNQGLSLAPALAVSGLCAALELLLLGKVYRSRKVALPRP
jgi:hypothetical protein